ncbi:MAG: STAS domain-containing protein [Deferribacteres bacterium]|nr:STAS domain-containing protein [Deferribacteres bacterium]
MFDYKSEQTEDKTVLTINGELTIQNAAVFKDVLLESLEKTGHLVLNLENVTDVDLSCLQLLCSAYLATTELNRRLTMDGGCPEAFRKAATDSGYLKDEACKPSACNKSCLWTEADYSRGGV